MMGVNLCSRAPRISAVVELRKMCASHWLCQEAVAETGTIDPTGIMVQASDKPSFPLACSTVIPTQWGCFFMPIVLLCTCSVMSTSRSHRLSRYPSSYRGLTSTYRFLVHEVKHFRGRGSS